LDRAKSETARFAQRMFAHRATNPLPARVCRDHKRGVSDVRATASLIRPQSVGPDNFSIFFGNVRVRVRSKPICERIFARYIWVESISIARGDNCVKDLPDNAVICFGRWANGEHRRSKRSTLNVQRSNFQRH
jgi:hypothetical protein